jgi:hypothetical protein
LLFRNQKPNKTRGQCISIPQLIADSNTPAVSAPVTVSPPQESVEQTIQSAEGCVTIENKNNETIDVKDTILSSGASHDHIQLLTRNCQNCRISMSVIFAFTSRLSSLSPSLGLLLLDQRDLNLFHIARSFWAPVPRVSIWSHVPTACSLCGVINCASTPHPILTFMCS